MRVKVVESIIFASFFFLLKKLCKSQWRKTYTDNRFTMQKDTATINNMIHEARLRSHCGATNECHSSAKHPCFGQGLHFQMHTTLLIIYENHSPFSQLLPMHFFPRETLSIPSSTYEIITSRNKREEQRQKKLSHLSFRVKNSTLFDLLTLIHLKWHKNPENKLIRSHLNTENDIIVRIFSRIHGKFQLEQLSYTNFTSSTRNWIRIQNVCCIIHLLRIFRIISLDDTFSSFWQKMWECFKHHVSRKANKNREWNEEILPRKWRRKEDLK